MINYLGYVFLAAALAVSVYGMVAQHLGVVRNNWFLVRSAQELFPSTFLSHLFSEFKNI